MSLTRRFLEENGVSDDNVDKIINEYTNTLEDIKRERNEYKTKAERLDAVQKELDDIKSKSGDWEKKYTEEHEAFEQFKAAQDAKQNEANKRDAYRALLRQANVSDARIDTVLKVTDLAQLELQDGKFTNEEELADGIKKEWADFITTSATSGAVTQTPPTNSKGATMTKEQIMSIKDTAERQKAIAENHELFGI